MPNQPPLNPDAIHQLFAVAMMEVLDAEKLQPGNRLAHVNDIQEVLNRLEKNVLAVARSKDATDVARMRDMVAEAIANPGESVHDFVSLPDLYQLLDHLAVAQPVVNRVEPIPATIQVISWEEEPEHECWKLAPDETFVGLIVKSDRAWSPADKYTLNIERPEVNDA